MKAKVLTCPHGLPFDTVSKWDVFKGMVACEQCYQEEWTNVRASTIAGCVALAALILVPASVLLAGVLW